MKPLLMEGGGGLVPPSTPVTASDSESDDEFTNIMTFNYALHNENVDGVFQLPTTEDIQFSEKGWA